MPHVEVDIFRSQIKTICPPFGKPVRMFEQEISPGIVNLMFGFGSVDFRKLNIYDRYTNLIDFCSVDIEKFRDIC